MFFPGRGSPSPPGAAKEEVERQMASRLLGVVAKDEDGEWIVDYAGPKAKEFIAGNLDAREIGMFPPVRAFAHRCRSEFQQQGVQGEKLFGRYSKLVRYLDARAALWGDAS